MCLNWSRNVYNEVGLAHWKLLRRGRKLTIMEESGHHMVYMIWYTGLLEMTVGVLTTCHTQYTSDSSICIFYLIELHSQFLLHTLQVLYMCTVCDSTGFFEIPVCVLTTCHTQYTSDSNICIFIFNRTTLPAFVTYLTGALYVHRLWFYRVSRNGCQGFNNLPYTIHFR